MAAKLEEASNPPDISRFRRREEDLQRSYQARNGGAAGGGGGGGEGQGAFGRTVEISAEDLGAGDETGEHTYVNPSLLATQLTQQQAAAETAAAAGGMMMMPPRVPSGELQSAADASSSATLLQTLARGKDKDKDRDKPRLGGSSFSSFGTSSTAAAPSAAPALQISYSSSQRPGTSSSSASSFAAASSSVSASVAAKPQTSFGLGASQTPLQFHVEAKPLPPPPVEKAAPFTKESTIADYFRPPSAVPSSSQSSKISATGTVSIKQQGPPMPSQGQLLQQHHQQQLRDTLGSSSGSSSSSRDTRDIRSNQTHESAKKALSAALDRYYANSGHTDSSAAGAAASQNADGGAQEDADQLGELLCYMNRFMVALHLIVGCLF
jgi:hypothetical protein